MKFFMMFLFVFSSQAFANVREEVIDLARKVSREARDARESDLQKAAEQLRKVLSQLRGGSSGGNRECLETVSSAYKRDGYNLDHSMNQAKKYCQALSKQSIGDYDFFQFVASAYKKDGYNLEHSYNQAIANSEKINDIEQIDCVITTYKKYKADGYNLDHSFNQAQKFCAN